MKRKPDYIGSVKLGSGRPKLLTHVGVTYDISTPEDELEKALAAVELGADFIADASLGERCKETVKLLCENVTVPVTALPGYALATSNGQSDLDDNITKEQILEVTEELLSYGLKGFTTHSIFRRKHLHWLEKNDRVFPFTSRMAHYIRKYMLRTGKENTFYVCFPELVQLAKIYNAHISLGTALRSPSVANVDGGFDEMFMDEIDDAAELIKLCRDNDVSVSLQAGGHISINRIEEWYRYTKEKGDDVALCILNMMSDRGMGHDNVTGAIGSAFLGKMGVEVICTETRAEHISQPTLDDIKESVIHYRIGRAIACPDMKKEMKVAKARAQGGCHLSSVMDNVIDPQGAYQAFNERVKSGLAEPGAATIDMQQCTMCGPSCPLIRIES